MTPDREQIARYWSTTLCDIAPGTIALRGYPIETLIGRLSLPGTIWLLLRGNWPTAEQAKLLEDAMVACVDHGPHAPSIAIARMAVTTGLPLNGALASAVNTLDDVHGGAGEQAMELYESVLDRAQAQDLEAAATAAIETWTETHGKYVPGFGHRFHPIDPRVAPLLSRVDAASARGAVTGRYAAAARAVGVALTRKSPRAIPMNVDGATAVVYAELGFAPPLARGLFCLARSVGILAHAWEQSQRGERNKGPIPRSFDYLYEGPTGLEPPGGLDPQNLAPGTPRL